MKDINTNVDLSVKDEEPEEIDQFDVMPLRYPESMQQTPMGGMFGDIELVSNTMMSDPIQNPLTNTIDQMIKMFDKSIKDATKNM